MAGAGPGAAPGAVPGAAPGGVPGAPPRTPEEAPGGKEREACEDAALPLVQWSPHESEPLAAGALGSPSKLLPVRQRCRLHQKSIRCLPSSICCTMNKPPEWPCCPVDYRLLEEH